MIDRPTLAAFRFGLDLPHAGAVAALTGPDVMAARHPTLGFDAALPMMARAHEARKMARQDPSQRKAYQAAIRDVTLTAEGNVRAEFARSVDAEDAFRERLCAFWADHFTTKARSAVERPLPGSLTHDAVRPHLTGRFEDMLIAATLHPAMLAYLDQSASIGPLSPVGKRRGRGVNENLAREVMELHSLGVGAAYGQTDVRQMALLLKGLDANLKEGFVFHPNRAEPGAEVNFERSVQAQRMSALSPFYGMLRKRPMAVNRKMLTFKVGTVTQKYRQKTDVESSSNDLRIPTLD